MQITVFFVKGHTLCWPDPDLLSNCVFRQNVKQILEEAELHTKSMERHDWTRTRLERHKRADCFINVQRREEKGESVEGNVGHERSFVRIVFVTFLSVSTGLSFFW